MSVSVIRSGLVANRCDSMACERRNAASVATRSVMSWYSESTAGPPGVSTRAPLACTVMCRPSID